MAPHFDPPPDHPLAGGTPLRNTIMQALYTPYPTTKHEREVVGILIIDLAAAVETQTFVAHTAAELFDEEMEVTIHPTHFVQAWAYLPLSPQSHTRGHAPSHAYTLHVGHLSRTSNGGAEATHP